jgi:hypothetical protein
MGSDSDMRFRALDLLLLLLISIGGIMAYRTGRERSRLSTEFQRLSKKTGEITIPDRSRVYFRAIQTGDPRSFAWRVYLPGGNIQVLRQNGVQIDLSLGGTTSEYIFRVRFRENKNGNLDLYLRSQDGSGTWSWLGSPPLAALLHDRWDQLHISQIGSTSAASLDPKSEAVLLEVKIPPELEEIARKVLDPDDFKQFYPCLFRLQLGPEKSKP